jgi:hypothetical protein
MTITRAAFAAALAVASVSLAWAGDARPKADIRPATLADLPPETAAAVRARPAQTPARPASAGSALVVVIDPATGRIVDVPPPPRGTPDWLEPPPEPKVDMSLRVTPSGFLYIDTSGYLYNSTATIDADGNIHVQCDEPGHDHAADAPPGQRP